MLLLQQKVFKMISKWTIIAVICVLHTICESAFVDTLSKCDIEDNNCLKSLTQNIVKNSASTGIKDFDIPPFDPMKLKDIKVPILGLLTITIEDGEARGVKDCVFNKFNANIKKGYLSLRLTCDLDVDAKVKLEDINPVIQNTLGTNSIEGAGKANIKLDKLQIKIKYFYDIIKKDGEIYIKCRPEDAVYNYSVGDAKLVAQKILLSGQDFTKPVNEFLGQNIKMVITSFGKNFFDVAIKVLSDILHTFFDKVPVKYFLTTDLTPYVTNG